MSGFDVQDGGELVFDDLFDPVSHGQAEQDPADDEEALLWLQLRATASRSDILVALRRHPIAQKAVLAVRRAVARLLAGPFPVHSLKLLGQRLSVHYSLRVSVRRAVAPVSSHQHHCFLVCKPAPGLEVLVDPSFRRQFELGCCVQQYKKFLTACVPEVFVGTLEMLTPLVSAAAAAARLSFSRLGMALPPWRDEDRLLSCWKPKRPRDEVCSGLPAMLEEYKASLLGPALAAAGQRPAGRSASPSPHRARRPVSHASSAELNVTSSAGAGRPPRATAQAPLVVLVGFKVPKPAVQADGWLASLGRNGASTYPLGKNRAAPAAVAACAPTGVTSPGSRTPVSKPVVYCMSEMSLAQKSRGVRIMSQSVPSAGRACLRACSVLLAQTVKNSVAPPMCHSSQVVVSRRREAKPVSRFSMRQLGVEDLLPRMRCMKLGA